MSVGKAYTLVELQAIVGDFIGSARWANAGVGLFVSDHTPSASDNLGTYTAIEAAWTGYAQQNATFGAASNDGTHGYSDSVVMSFPVVSGGTGQTVYGYFIHDTANTTLLFAERIAAPVSVIDGFPVPLQVRVRDANA